MGRRTFFVPGFEVVVGWDPPLQTFFAQTYPTNKKHDHPKCRSEREFVEHGDETCLCDLDTEVWIGASRGEIPNVETLRHLMGATKIPQEVAQGLREDQEANR